MAANDFEQNMRTPEYTAFQSCYESLVDTITQEPGTFCNSLFAKSYISSEVRDYARVDAITDKQKAHRLVDSISDRIKHDPVTFHGFLDILKTPFTNDLLKKLQECYKTYHDQVVGDACIQQKQNLKPISTHNSTAFMCPYCRKCTLEEFLSRRRCLEATGKTLFPYLNTPSLSVQNRRILETRLQSDTEKMITLFAETDTNIAQNLKGNITLLKNFVLNLVSSFGHEEHLEKLEKAETIPGMFVALRPFKSFLNYRIIEKIVNRFGSEENQQDMQTYITAFIDFCKRSAFQIPLNIVPHFGGTSNTRVVSVKLASKGEASLKDVVSSQQKIATILGVNDWDLHIASIEKGCVCLRFLVSARLAEKKFPLSQFQIRALSNIYVTIMEDHSMCNAEAAQSPTQVIRQKEHLLNTPVNRKQLDLLSLKQAFKRDSPSDTQNQNAASKLPDMINCYGAVIPQVHVTVPIDSSRTVHHLSPPSKPGHLSLKKTSSSSSDSSGYESSRSSMVCESPTSDIHFEIPEQHATLTADNYKNNCPKIDSLRTVYLSPPSKPGHLPLKKTSSSSSDSSGYESSRSSMVCETPTSDINFTEQHATLTADNYKNNCPKITFN